LEDKAKVEEQLRMTLVPNEANQIEVIQLTNEDMERNSFKRQHGLLYLPKPYVVPGGRFNEVII
jgi:alpha,alpha-trehalase